MEAWFHVLFLLLQNIQKTQLISITHPTNGTVPNVVSRTPRTLVKQGTLQPHLHAQGAQPFDTGAAVALRKAGGPKAPRDGCVLHTAYA